jgi:hypothetical protein
MATFMAMACLAFVSGCGPTTNNVLKGKVTLKKKDGAVVPVTGGSITFWPTDAPESSIYKGGISADATFSVAGVPNGTLKVMIDTQTAKNQGAYPGGDGGGGPSGRPKDAPTPAAGGGGTPLVFVEIPVKYAKAATTDIVWDVKKDGYTKDIELKEE